jgi:DNA-binding NtrC family response regulator
MRTRAKSRLRVGPGATRCPKVLIVDDSEICCEFVRVALSARGMKVLAMTTHFGFMKVLRQEVPDLVLVDVEMPSVSGPKLIELAIRKHASDCPVLLYSDRPDAELDVLAQSCGATGYVRKTPDQDRLYREVQRWVATSRARARAQ